jgi:tRNA nucleotidyltransferase (CCA-adding enzyme)
LDAAAEIARREKLDKRSTLILLLSALCHDLGKPRTTVQKERDGVMRWTAPQHDKAGVTPTKTLLERMGVPKSMWDEITTLVAEHMAHINPLSIGGVRRLINRLGEGGTNLKMLSMVVEADLSGRPPLIGKCPECFEWFFEVEKEQPKTQVGKIAPIITGAILMENGFTEGKELGKMFKKLYELQLDGRFEDIENGLLLI